MQVLDCGGIGVVQGSIVNEHINSVRFPPSGCDPWIQAGILVFSFLFPGWLLGLVGCEDHTPTMANSRAQIETWLFISL